MFFIGIFGIEQKQKEVSDRRNIICPSCEALGSYRLIKVYNYFHIFFIPIFKWNIRYYIKTSCCNKMFEINAEIGKRIEDGEPVELKSDALQSLGAAEESNRCYHCGSTIDPRYSFCPYCGKNLK
ncbi:MAG: zinc ribbon domain-containing protein [Epulopiscium sp.]|nr:zinc ribbon domain-containing protein [Candidatus Epulonipiscium sp.]